MNGRISIHGKCILLGEHSVVRGFPAVVFPLRSCRLELDFERFPGQGLTIDSGEYPLGNALDLALGKLGARLPEGKWQLKLRSDIPVRAGLGSSAALSVAVVRFLHALGLSEDSFSLALEIENLFHGQSSGIDVAATQAKGPIRFQRERAPVALTPAWQPRLYLADSGLRSATKTCVEKVIALRKPELDQAMGQAAETAEAALRDSNGFSALAAAMEKGREIFAAWGLIPPAVASQMDALKKAGAAAVKPTGSGDGGYILSLWEKDPPTQLARELGLTPLSADS